MILWLGRADGRIGGRTDGKGMETWYGAKGGVVDLFPGGVKGKKKNLERTTGGWLGGWMPWGGGGFWSWTVIN